jgi:hypothetical protein
MPNATCDGSWDAVADLRRRNEPRNESHPSCVMNGYGHAT